MASNVQPTIVWYKYVLSQDGSTLVPSSLQGNNTVDYNAVQAGQYSPAICVRPQFSNDVSTSGGIGSVRLWWSTITATSPQSGTSTSVSLPASGWVLKYYVSDCTSTIGSTSTSLTPNQICAKMLNYLGISENVEKVANKKTFTVGSNANDVTFQSGMAWARSVWQASTDNTYVSMQPVPFSGYETSVSVQQNLYGNSTHYGSSWLSTVFGQNAASGEYATGSALYYAVGGVLTNAYKCNIKGYVDGNQTTSETSGFPYIFFTIKAPTTAEAGTWSGWACRISYIWPYSAPTTAVS